MHLLSCEHPVRVWNKYIGEYVFAKCGKCSACKHAYASRWIAALEAERSQHEYTFFITLTYDERNLPKLVPYLDFDGSNGWYNGQFHPETRFVSSKHDGTCIAYNDFEFDEKSDLDYFQRSFLINAGIPYASFRDVQLFLKRLNKYFHDNVSYQYKNFRYFFVSEFGSTTHRPHFHGILFCDNRQCAEAMQDCVSSLWKLGRTDTQYVEKSACSYVAQYVNCIFDLPSFYKAKQIRPKFICSKHPSIGSYNKSFESLQKIFNEGIVSQGVQRYSNETSFSVVPLQQSIENRLFPKLSFFSTISDTLRIKLYTISRRFGGKNFSEWFENLKNWYGSVLHETRGCTSCELFHYLGYAFDKDYEALENFCRRLYYISRKFLRLCNYLYDISDNVEYFVLAKIKQYWNNKELYKLRQFYDMQHNYACTHSSEDLVFCYPEYAYQNNAEDTVKSLSDVSYYRQLVANSKMMLEKLTKTHFKNAYFESLEVRNNPLFHLIKDFYYAKKRDEISQTFATSG